MRLCQLGYGSMVEHVGLEPTASGLQDRRSSNDELMPHGGP